MTLQYNMGYMKKLITALLISVLCCIGTTAQTADNNLPSTLVDSISNALLNPVKKRSYTCVDIPDSVLQKRYGDKYGFSVYASKSDSIRIPDVISQNNRALPDSVKIEFISQSTILDGPLVFLIYNGHKGSVFLRRNADFKTTLSESYSMEVLRLINKIVFVNKNKIIIAKKNIPLFIYSDLPSIGITIYCNGKTLCHSYDFISREQETCIVTYSRSFIDLWNMIDQQLDIIYAMREQKRLKEIKERMHQRFQKYTERLIEKEAKE